MPAERIVSFFPSATELLYELGAGDKVFGVTHECIYPDNAKTKPRVINSVFDPTSMSSKEIDDTIVKLMRENKEIYKLDKSNLINANPDLIISQDTCEVCSAYSGHVTKALSILKKRPDIIPLDPHDIKGIFISIERVAKKIGYEKKGYELVESLEKRISNIKNCNFKKRPKVLALEWIDPFFSSGHWVPEMVNYAGGTNLISYTGEHSRRIKFDEISQSKPDLIVLMPCGFDTERTIKEYKKFLASNPDWKKLQAVKDNNVYAVDANSYFSKPSIRTITGIEILAKIFHPELFEKVKVSEESFKQIKS